MPTNLAVAGMEQEATMKQSDVRVALLYTFCCHHQAALAKKPLVLSADGIASGQRRNAHDYL